MKNQATARDEIVGLLNAQQFEAVRDYGAKGLTILKKLIAADDTLLAAKALRAVSCYTVKQAEPILMAAAQSRDACSVLPQPALRQNLAIAAVQFCSTCSVRKTQAYRNGPSAAWTSLPIHSSRCFALMLMHANAW